MDRTEFWVYLFNLPNCHYYCHMHREKQIPVPCQVERNIDVLKIFIFKETGTAGGSKKKMELQVVRKKNKINWNCRWFERKRKETGIVGGSKEKVLIQSYSV